MIIAFIVIAWLAFGAFAYAGNFAAMQSMGKNSIFGKEFIDKFNADWYRRDMAMSVFAGLMGPVGLLIIAFMTGFFEHGLKWR